MNVYPCVSLFPKGAWWTGQVCRARCGTRVMGGTGHGADHGGCPWYWSGTHPSSSPLTPTAPLPHCTAPLPHCATVSSLVTTVVSGVASGVRCSQCCQFCHFGHYGPCLGLVFDCFVIFLGFMTFPRIYDIFLGLKGVLTGVYWPLFPCF